MLLALSSFSESSIPPPISAIRADRLSGRGQVADRCGRVVLHYLPSQAPEENAVEQVFWRLHEAVTRNHRCQTIDELIDAAMDWLELEGAGRPPIETYNLAA